MTDSDMRRINAAIWGQVNVQALEVTGDLFGMSHRFEHEGHRVEIGVPAVNLNDQLRPIEEQSHLAGFRSGLTESPTRETNSYEIGFLEALIELPDLLTIPQAMLEASPKRLDLAGPILSEELERLNIAYENHLASAVAHWKAVVRWITGSRAIDTPGTLPGRQAEAVFQLQGLISLPDRKRFWRPALVMAFQKQTELNVEAWTRIGKVLAAGHHIPIWSRFLDQAFHYLQRWDDSGCVLSCAIACETTAKQINALSVTRFDGTPNAHPAKNRPSMAAVIEDWDKLTGLSDSTARTAEVRELVKIRNNLMHSGGIELALDHAKARRLFDATVHFVELGERLYYDKRGEANPKHLPV